VVIGILAALAAVAVPTFSRFFGQGTAEASQTELPYLQAAMDAMMAENSISLVDAEDDWTNDFALKPTGENPLVLPLYPHFLRNNPTRCDYTWDTTGKLEQLCP